MIWKQLAAIVAILGVTAAVLVFQLGVFDEDAAQPALGLLETGDFERGPNGGRMLRDGEFGLEVAIFESGIPPEFHLYGYEDDGLLAPSQFTAGIELTRLGGVVDRFVFTPEAEYLRGDLVVTEPHSFDVGVTASYRGREYRWQYESHEGRTRIPRRVSEAQQIRVEPAGPAVITDLIELTGTVQTDPGRVSQVRVRFPGIVTSVRRSVGDVVSKGESLGSVETNESLRSVSIEAPIGGLIVNRNVQEGQVTGDDPLFVIADLSQVWVQLNVFGADLQAVQSGQSVVVTTLEGREISGAIEWISPLVAHGSQSLRARVPLPNPDGELRPGQFVRAQVATSEVAVPLAVKRSGLQAFRDFDVVFAQIGEDYEVRMLELGRFDAQYVEVLGGINPGDLYVSENSYLIKADIEKSGATHDH